MGGLRRARGRADPVEREASFLVALVLSATLVAAYTWHAKPPDEAALTPATASGPVAVRLERRYRRHGSYLVQHVLVTEASGNSLLAVPSGEVVIPDLAAVPRGRHAEFLIDRTAGVIYGASLNGRVLLSTREALRPLRVSYYGLMTGMMVIMAVAAVRAELLYRRSRRGR